MPVVDFEDWTRGVEVITGSTPLGADFPDWTIAVDVTGGGGGGAYASLTGAGQTTTPGDLAQQGGFSVVDGLGTTGFVAQLLGTNGNIELLNDSTTGANVITNSGTGGTQLEDTGGGGLTVQATGGGLATVTTDAGLSVADSHSGVIGIKLHETGTAPIEVSAAATGGTSGGISITDATTSSGAAGIHIGTNGSPVLIGAGSGGFPGTVTVQNAAGNLLAFYGHTGHTQQTVGGSRGGNAALASLLTALANMGLIIDGSSP